MIQAIKEWTLRRRFKKWAKQASVEMPIILKQMQNLEPQAAPTGLVVETGVLICPEGQSVKEYKDDAENVVLISYSEPE